MWKGVNADYKAALTRFTQSGTHESNFYHFCIGKKEPYYLRLLLSEKPHLNDMVEADLREACNLFSSTTKEDCEQSAEKQKFTKYVPLIV
jgi:hypothetical protein